MKAQFNNKTLLAIAIAALLPAGTALAAGTSGGTVNFSGKVVTSACAISAGSANIDVDMIIQNVGDEGTTDFSFTVPRGDYKPTLELMKGLKDSLGATEVNGDDTVCKVSVVGLGMRSHVGVASKMFRTLAEEGINIQMISTSEIKVSVLIDEKYMELATRVLHKAFELE